MAGIWELKYLDSKSNEWNAVVIGASQEDAREFVTEKAGQINIIGTSVISERIDALTDRYINYIKNACGFLTTDEIRENGYFTEEQLNEKLKEQELIWKKERQKLKKQIKILKEKKPEKKKESNRPVSLLKKNK